MSRLLITSFFMFVFLLINGQEQGYTGPVFRTNSKIQFQGFFGIKDSTVYGVETEFGLRRLRSIYLSGYNRNSLEQIGQVDITPPVDEDIEWFPTEIVSLEGGVFLLSEAKNRKTKERFLMAHKVDEKGNQADPICLDTLAANNPPGTEFHIIGDTSDSFLTVMTLHPFESFQNQKITIKNFDAALNFNWSWDVELPNKDNNFSFLTLLSDAPDRIYCLAEQKMNISNEFNIIKENNKFTVLGFDVTNRKVEELELRLENEWIQQIELLKSGNDLVVAGYFSNEPEEQIGGIFTVFLTPDLQIRDAVLEEITIRDFHLTDYSNLSLTNVKLLKLHRFSNGNYVVVGERSYKEVNPRYDMRTDITSYTDLYYFQEVFVNILDETGVPIRNIVIPKYQVTNNDMGMYSSVFLAEYSDKIAVLYNDNDKNFNKHLTSPSDYRIMSNYRKNSGVMVVVSEEGEVEKKRIYKADLKMNFRPGTANQFKNGSVFLMGERVKQNRVIRLD